MHEFDRMFRCSLRRQVFIGRLRVSAGVRIVLLAINQAPVALQLSATPSGNGRVYQEYTYTPDGQFVLYRADFDANNIYELYSAQVSAANPQIRLNDFGQDQR